MERIKTYCERNAIPDQSLLEINIHFAGDNVTPNEFDMGDQHVKFTATFGRADVDEMRRLRDSLSYYVDLFDLWP